MATVEPTEAKTAKAAGSAPKKSRSLTAIGGVMIAIGVAMIVVGIIAWTVISSQLAAQKMTVPDDANSNAGVAVTGPFTAWSMQETIEKHANGITDGQTYAELGKVVEAAKAEFGEDSEEAAAAQGIRTTAMNASLLRTSLFTSILSFGVSFFAIGTGTLTILGGAGFIVTGRRK